MYSKPSKNLYNFILRYMVGTEYTFEDLNVLHFLVFNVFTLMNSILLNTTEKTGA